MQFAQERSFQMVRDAVLRLGCRVEKHVGSVEENRPDIMKGGCLCCINAKA
jgi:hypothetical protein